MIISPQNTLAFEDGNACAVFLRVRAEDIAMLNFYLEGLEGLGVMRTIDPGKGEVVILTPRCNLADLDRFLSSLDGEMMIWPILPPEEVKNDWLLAESLTSQGAGE